MLRPGADWPSGIPGESPVGRRGWDGPKYRPTSITNRPSLFHPQLYQLFSILHRTRIISSTTFRSLKSMTEFYTPPRDLYSHSWCLFFENFLKCLLYSSNVFRQSNFVLGVIKCQSL